MPKDMQEMLLNAWRLKNREGGKRPSCSVERSRSSRQRKYCAILVTGVAAGLVPASALTAGLGGVAAWCHPRLYGYPWFPTKCNYGP
jgi:hypothetical protein